MHARGRGRPRQARCYARGRAETPEAGGPQGRRAPLARAALRHTVSFYASRAGAALVVGIMNRVWLSCVDERAIALPRGKAADNCPALAPLSRRFAIPAVAILELVDASMRVAG